MNILRLATVTLSLTLLAACGGGGGGGGTPTTGGGGGGMLEQLPDALFSPTQAREAREVVGGELPNNPPDQSDLETRVVAIAEMSNALLFSEGATGSGINASRMIICTPGEAMCTAMIDTDTTDNRGPDTQMERPEEINGPVLFNDGEALAGYNDQYSIVMTNGRIPLIQARAAGRVESGPGSGRYEFRSYGGWMMHSFFIVQHSDATVQGNRFSAFSAYSFGSAAGTNPTGTGMATWNGVMVGVDKENSIVFQGNAVIRWVNTSAGFVNGEFNTIKNLSEGGDYSTPTITWNSIPLEEGAFTSNDAFVNMDNASIWGNFYGGSHEEVGGIFEVGEIIGAFGAQK